MEGSSSTLTRSRFRAEFYFQNLIIHLLNYSECILYYTPYVSTSFHLNALLEMTLTTHVHLEQLNAYSPSPTDPKDTARRQSAE